MIDMQDAEEVMDAEVADDDAFLAKRAKRASRVPVRDRPVGLDIFAAQLWPIQKTQALQMVDKGILVPDVAQRPGLYALAPAFLHTPPPRDVTRTIIKWRAIADAFDGPTPHVHRVLLQRLMKIAGPVRGRGRPLKPTTTVPAPALQARLNAMMLTIETLTDEVHTLRQSREAGGQKRGREDTLGELLMTTLEEARRNPTESYLAHAAKYMTDALAENLLPPPTGAGPAPPAGSLGAGAAGAQRMTLSASWEFHATRSMGELELAVASMTSDVQAQVNALSFAWAALECTSVRLVRPTVFAVTAVLTRLESVV